MLCYSLSIPRMLITYVHTPILSLSSPFWSASLRGLWHRVIFLWFIVQVSCFCMQYNRANILPFFNICSRALLSPLDTKIICLFVIVSLKFPDCVSFADNDFRGNSLWESDRTSCSNKCRILSSPPLIAQMLISLLDSVLSYPTPGNIPQIFLNTPWNDFLKLKMLRTTKSCIKPMFILTRMLIELTLPSLA